MLQPVAWRGTERAEYTIGVAGCGKQKTYIVVCPLDSSAATPSAAVGEGPQGEERARHGGARPRRGRSAPRRTEPGGTGQAGAEPGRHLVSVPFQSNTNFNTGPLNGTQNILNIQPVLR